MAANGQATFFSGFNCGAHDKGIGSFGLLHRRRVPNRSSRQSPVNASGSGGHPIQSQGVVVSVDSPKTRADTAHLRSALVWIAQGLEDLAVLTPTDSRSNCR